MTEPATTPSIDPAQTRVVAEWKHASPLFSCRFDPSGRYVVAGAFDHVLVRWELATGAATSLVGHESWCRGLGYTPDGAWLLSGGYDGRLIWWPLAEATPTPPRVVEAHAGWIRQLDVSPDGARVATVGNDGRARLWHVASGELALDLPEHGTQVHHVRFLPDGERLITGDLKGQLRLFDLASGQEVRKYDASGLYTYFAGQGVDFGGVRSMAISPDGALVAAGGTTEATNPLGAIHKPLVVVFEIESGTQRQAHKAKENFDGSVWGLRFHPNGMLVGVTGGGGGGNWLFWRIEDASEQFKIALPDLARDMDLHADGLRLASAHADGHLRISTLAPAGA